LLIFLELDFIFNHSPVPADNRVERLVKLPAYPSGRWSRQCLMHGSRRHEASPMATTVLVVDDSVTMVLSLKTTLTLNGFEVETASNGQEAIDKLQAGLKPRLILTDINMPVMGGMELIRSVRAMPGLKFVPILTLTTESEAGKRNAGKLAGATGWLVKPVSGNDLVAAMRKVLPGV
jgi:two-component system, chemotaxis family, chemotaxis protein CheY